MEEWLRTIHFGDGELTSLERAAMICGVIAVAFLVDFISTRIFMPIIKKVTAKTKTQWDDILLSEKVLKSFSAILPPFILLLLLPMTIDNHPGLEDAVMRCCSVYMIIMVIRALCIGVGAIYELFYYRHHVKARSLMGIVQTIKILFWIFGVILIVSTLINRSPTLLITGLGAIATVLMLIFQDSIKGLVAGIQLSVNDMMRPGDWISMPKCNADGVVTDVTLNTVKVRNWDNTITTIPPYTLVNDSFQNWRGMSESNGRRMARAINIDMHSIRFCTSAEVERFIQEGILNEGILNEGKDICSVTNLQAYRAYLLQYMRKSNEINTDMTTMVRQLSPSPEGLPIQIYCFSYTKDWVSYEDLQSRLIEFAISSLDQFGLYVYQRSSDNEQRIPS